MDWRVQRIATHHRYHVDPRRIRTEWTWLEVLEANRTIDMLEDAEAEAAARK